MHTGAGVGMQERRLGDLREELLVLDKMEKECLIDKDEHATLRSRILSKYGMDPEE